MRTGWEPATAGLWLRTVTRCSGDNPRAAAQSLAAPDLLCRDHLRPPCIPMGALLACPSQVRCARMRPGVLKRSTSHWPDHEIPGTGSYRQQAGRSCDDQRFFPLCQTPSGVRQGHFLREAEVAGQRLLTGCQRYDQGGFLLHTQHVRLHASESAIDVQKDRAGASAADSARRRLRAST